MQFDSAADREISMRILVVDDDLTNRVLLQEVLSEFGAVHTCVNGDEALEECRSALRVGTPYELICLDIRMPGIDGLETLRLIRQEEQRYGRTGAHASKVIMTTAADDLKSVLAAHHELCDAYMLKPLDPAALVAQARALCPPEATAGER